MLFARRVGLLERRLARLPSLLVALSGGVDSAALLGIAARALPGRVLAATARSPAVPDEEVEAAAAAAARLGVPHRVVASHELDDTAYRANRGDRCYFCRQEMYGVFSRLAKAEGMVRIADGLLADDVDTDRPGVRAAREYGVLHPLREAAFGKAEARRLARAWGLDLHDKPAQPCLASRLPIGIAVTEDRLRRVHRAEQAVRAFGFREVRVRCEDRHGRIEVGRVELAQARRLRLELEHAVRGAGFLTAALDDAGYRMGGARSLSE